MASLAYLHDSSSQVVTFTASQHQYEYGDESHCRRPIALKLDGSLLHRDSLNIASAKSRKSFASTLNGRAEAVAAELLVLSEVLDKESEEENDGAERQPSQATRIVNLAISSGVAPFHDQNGDPYADIAIDGRRETWPIKAKAFRLYLSRLFFDEFGSVPGSQALQDAQNVLSGQGIFGDVEHLVWCRLAKHDGCLYLDLGDPAWQAVKIAPDGWSVIAAVDVPVRFRRPRGMIALPFPIPGGSIDELDPFLNAEDEDDRIALKAWLLAVLQTDGARAILELNGEQGSCKTTVARVLRRTIDPCSVPIRTAPRDERDLIIAASNGLIVAHDNVSEIKEWQSDAYCRLSTGGGIGSRELYSDTDEVILDAQRACLLTAITSVVERSDMLDRTMSITLPPIPSDQRLTEAELWAQFDEAHPRILGALLDAASTALRRLASVTLLRKPRLADFVTWVESGAPAFGWGEGDFLAVFESNRKDADQVAIESLAVGPALVKFMDERDQWNGTATELLTELNEIVDAATRKDQDWPKGANRLSGQLRRLAPNLRQIGLWVVLQRLSSQRRIVITKNPEIWDRQYRHEPAAQPEPNDDRDDTGDLFADFSGDGTNTQCCVCGGPLPPDVRYVCDACG
ncbi:MAG: hypothetical protein ACJ789_12960 [Thermomicrobiales bacterium]